MPALEESVKWLEKAVAVAETPEQRAALELLIKYYRTGDLKTWDDFNVAWVKDTEEHGGLHPRFRGGVQRSLGQARQLRERSWK